MTTNSNWPELPYDKFFSTGYLLHRCVQMIGKLKLLTPFEPEWSNVILNLSVRGLTSGMIPYQNKTFAIDVDLIDHKLVFLSSDGKRDEMNLSTMSVSELYDKMFSHLKKIGIDATINPKPQEVYDPILFHEDKEIRNYDKKLATAWWQILTNIYWIMLRYHAKFFGKTQTIGLMWGTFDLRDVRFKDSHIEVPTEGPNAGYLRRNAMDSAQVESGWWSGSPTYTRPAFYSFTFPEPPNIAEIKLLPSKAKWDDKINLFILDYDDVRNSKTPDQDIQDFFSSTYQGGATLAGWDKKLIGTGQPV